MVNLRVCLFLAFFASIAYSQELEHHCYHWTDEEFDTIQAAIQAGTWTPDMEKEMCENNGFLFSEFMSPGCEHCWCCKFDEESSETPATAPPTVLPPTFPPTTTEGPGDCVDVAPVEKCEKRKAKGHCEDSTYITWAYRKCRATCGLCGCTDSPGWTDGENDGCNWWRDFCENDTIDQDYWSAEELECYDNPQEHCCGCGRADGTSTCEPDPCNARGNTGETCVAGSSDFTCNCGAAPCSKGEKCVNGACGQCTSTEGRARDSGDDPCRWYGKRNNWKECGDHDDDDFTASEMCCECGGGENTV